MLMLLMSAVEAVPLLADVRTAPPFSPVPPSVKPAVEAPKLTLKVLPTLRNRMPSAVAPEFSSFNATSCLSVGSLDCAIAWFSV